MDPSEVGTRRSRFFFVELALVWGFLDWFDGFFGLVVSLIFNDFVCFDTPKEVLTKTPTIEL